LDRLTATQENMQKLNSCLTMFLTFGNVHQPGAFSKQMTQ